MNAYLGVGVEIHKFSTSALVGGGQFHASADLPSEKESRIGDWVGPRTGLDGVQKKKKSCPYRNSN
jgi:hypothetical protein